jgi:phage shock protein C
MRRQGILMNKRLLRSSNNRFIAGVCGGFAEYFSIDPILVRIILVIIGLGTAGTAVIAYVIAAIVMPQQQSYPFKSNDGNDGDMGSFEREMEDWKRKENWNNAASSSTGNNRKAIGIILIGFGLMFLTKELFRWIDTRYIFPLLLIVVGTFIVYRGRGRSV